MIFEHKMRSLMINFVVDQLSDQSFTRPEHDLHPQHMKMDQNIYPW